MAETPDNIFTISARSGGVRGCAEPCLLKFHQGKNYRYSLSEYGDEMLVESFRRRFHLDDLEGTIRKSLRGTQRTLFDEFGLGDSEIDAISAALKERIESCGYSNTFPIYVQREETPNLCSFPLEMLHTHFRRVC